MAVGVAGFLAQGVAHQDFWRQALLPGTVPDGHLRHLNGIGQKHSQIPQGAELDSEPEFVVIAAALSDQDEIGLVQKEVAGHLLGSGISRKPPVTGGLVIGEKFDRHWNSLGELS